MGRFTTKQTGLTMLFVARENKMARPGPVGEWFTRCYLEWQRSERERKTVEEFAEFVGVKRGTMNQWMNGARRPKGAYVKIVADKLGAEIYDLLGLARPTAGSITPLDLFKSFLTPEQQADIERRILEYAEANDRKKAKEQGSHAEAAG